MIFPKAVHTSTKCMRLSFTRCLISTRGVPILSAPLSPHFLLSAPLSPHHFGSVFSNPTSFWVRIWALTPSYFEHAFKPSHLLILSVPLSPHFHFECVFEPSPLFRVRCWAIASFWVRLWALTSWVVRCLTLPPFECAFELSPSNFLGRLPITIWSILHVFFYLGRSPITMRPFFHLGRSPITTRPLFPFSILGRSPITIWPFSMFFYLGRSPITIRPFLHLGRSPITSRPLFLFPFG
jgi:hypothetical protein